MKIDKEKMIDTITDTAFSASFKDGISNYIDAIGLYMEIRAQVEDAVDEYEGKSGEIR